MASDSRAVLTWPLALSMEREWVNVRYWNLQVDTVLAADLLASLTFPKPQRPHLQGAEVSKFPRGGLQPIGLRGMKSPKCLVATRHPVQWRHSLCLLVEGFLPPAEQKVSGTGSQGFASGSLWEVVGATPISSS